MQKEILTVYVDIDDTICKTNGMDYPNSVPITANIEKVNALYDEGHTIVYWTARGQKSGIDWTELTRGQLERWGAKFHDVKLTKPPYDVFIDDKVINSREWEKGKWLEKWTDKWEDKPQER
jgi:hypothetical protein